MTVAPFVGGAIDEGTLASIRESLPSIQGVAYLNTGTSGPLPLSVEVAMAEESQALLATPRIGPEHGQRVRDLKVLARERLAAMLACETGEVALTHNTTEGMNLATLGVNWQPGDEAITTNVEHPGALFPLYAARERFNITIKTANVFGKSPAEIVATIESLISSRTKLVSLSHVSFTTGQLLPIAEIAAVAHQHGALVLVDGAQTFGSIALDMRALGCDMYAGSGQKWLCGPEGSGVLYVSQEALSQTRITMAGYGTMDGYNDYGGFQVKGNAQRFEQGTANSVSFAGQAAAAGWLAEIGLANVYGRTHELANTAIARLSREDGIEVLTPDEHAGLVSARVEGIETDELVSQLRDRRVLIRSVRAVGAVRLSLGFFNIEDEIETAVQEIVAIRAGSSG